MSREFTVLIAGAGMAGLMLGQLLERAGIEYQIFDRQTTVNSMGSVMGIAPNVMPLFEQLGMLDDIQRISKMVDQSIFLDENLGVVAQFTNDMEKRIGYGFHVFARPDIYDLLLSKVPTHKIHWGKKVQSVVEDDDKVTIIFEDNSQVSGDICVGADGAYSMVRENLYNALAKNHDFPKEDLEEFKVGFYNLLGTTGPLDPEKYPELKAAACKIQEVMRSSTKHSMHTYTIPGNRFCWNVVDHVEKPCEPSTSGRRSSEWGSDVTEAMCAEVRDFKAPFGGTMADFIDATPKDKISKVMHEEKLFKTWFGKRTVLIGDACHKMSPAAGQGAASAIHDALILANKFYDLPDHPTLSEFKEAFAAYKNERFPKVEEAFLQSKRQSKIIFGQGLVDRLLRWAIFKIIPGSLLLYLTLEIPMAYRPQATFLPMVPDRGTAKVDPRKPSKRYQVDLASPSRV